jgi:hypothetical protein
VALRALASFGVGTAFVSAVALLAAQGPPTQAGQPAVDFATEIHPILQSKCLGCHGDKLKLSKLDLRTREGAKTGGAVTGAVVQPATSGGGTHGYLPGPRDMESSFFIVGEGVPAGRNSGPSTCVASHPRWPASSA